MLAVLHIWIPALLLIAGSNATISKLNFPLRKGERVNVFVSFEPKPKFACNPSSHWNSTLTPSDRSHRLATLRDKLIQSSEDSQADIIKLVDGHQKRIPLNYTTFWVTNQLYIAGADDLLLAKITDSPKVTKVHQDVHFGLMSSLARVRRDGVDEVVGPHPDGSPSWPLAQTNISSAWEVGGNKGEGIIIGFIDTGARASHEILKDSFLGDFGWYDPIDFSTTPIDSDGHGSMLTSIAVGGKGLGVAPSAKWSACRTCKQTQTDNSTEQLCSLYFLIACIQFFFCPTSVNGSVSDCSKAPDIITNSWSGINLEGYEFFDDIIQCWTYTRTIPVFPAGDNGTFGCSTITYPADHSDLITVANMATERDLHPDSSTGPTRDGRIKPDIAAPGTGIVAVNMDTDSSYTLCTGTACSAAHVSGALALVLSASRENNIPELQDIHDLVSQTSDKICTSSSACKSGSCDAPKFPNNINGYGRINGGKLLSGLGKKREKMKVKRADNKEAPNFRNFLAENNIGAEGNLDRSIFKTLLVNERFETKDELRPREGGSEGHDQSPANPGFGPGKLQPVPSPPIRCWPKPMCASIKQITNVIKHKPLQKYSQAAKPVQVFRQPVSKGNRAGVKATSYLDRLAGKRTSGDELERTEVFYETTEESRWKKKGETIGNIGANVFPGKLENSNKSNPVRHTTETTTPAGHNEDEILKDEVRIGRKNDSNKAKQNDKGSEETSTRKSNTVSKPTVGPTTTEEERESKGKLQKTQNSEKVQTSQENGENKKKTEKAKNVAGNLEALLNINDKKKDEQSRKPGSKSETKDDLKYKSNPNTSTRPRDKSKSKDNPGSGQERKEQKYKTQNTRQSDSIGALLSSKVEDLRDKQKGFKSTTPKSHSERDADANSKRKGRVFKKPRKKLESKEDSSQKKNRGKYKGSSESSEEKSVKQKKGRKRVKLKDAHDVIGRLLGFGSTLPRTSDTDPIQNLLSANISQSRNHEGGRLRTRVESIDTAQLMLSFDPLPSESGESSGDAEADGNGGKSTEDIKKTPGGVLINADEYEEDSYDDNSQSEQRLDTINLENQTLKSPSLTG